MKSFAKLSWLIGSFLQLMPLLLHAQVETMITGPMVPDPIPSPKVVAPPSVISRPAIPPSQARAYGTDPASNMAIPSTGAKFEVPDEASSEMAQDSKERNPITDVLDFWFGFLPGPTYFPQNKMSIWFASNPEIDRQIRDNFGEDVIKAERGEYNHWRDTPRGRLALILLLDQIPRHIYRNQYQQFILDRMARALVIEGIQKGDDKRLYPVERAFLYLPLEHAEDIQMQNLSVSSYRQLLAESPEILKPLMADFFQAAMMHQKQIIRFGRFPYRNAILGRESTPEENVFLMQWKKR